jgi:hypothetical protein
MSDVKESYSNGGKRVSISILLDRQNTTLLQKACDLLE